MDQHALAVLKDASWELLLTKRIQDSGDQDGKFKAIACRLLYTLIIESKRLGGTILDQFWHQLGDCHPRLKENIEILKLVQFVAPEHSLEVLFQGLDRDKVNFKPVLNMAMEYFNHLGIAFLNPGGRESGSCTPFSVSEVVGKETEELLQLVKEDETFGKRKQEILKALSFKRDGPTCPLTGVKFMPFEVNGFFPALVHIVPNSVLGKPDTLTCIATFAGSAARDQVVHCLNDVSNTMNLEMNAHDTYNNRDLRWGIEAKEDNGEVKYIYRRVPHRNGLGPGYIRLKDGDEIAFGRGPDGQQLNKGPHPLLCNLQLGVTRVLKMSGAADIIFEWKEEADDGGLPHVYIASEEFCNMLDARLSLSGQALVT